MRHGARSQCPPHPPGRRASSHRPQGPGPCPRIPAGAKMQGPLACPGAALRMCGSTAPAPSAPSRPDQGHHPRQAATRMIQANRNQNPSPNAGSNSARYGAGALKGLLACSRSVSTCLPAVRRYAGTGAGPVHVVCMHLLNCASSAIFTYMPLPSAK